MERVLGRKRLFLENFFVYGLTGIIGRAIPFLMLPIISRIIPDISIYGVSDVMHVVVSFGAAFAGLGMYDAMFRMFFEKNDTSFKEQVCTIALKTILISSLIVSLFTALFSKALANALLGNEEYYGWILFCSLQIFISGIQTIIGAPTRMQNKRKIYLVLSIINPLIGYGISIPIILFIDPLTGLMLGGFVSTLSQLAIFFWLNRRWFTHNEKNREIAKELLKIGLPLVPVFLIYWVFHSCDRIMISQMLGLEQNGIYAIGSKVSQVSQLIYTAFAGGWQFFAFSTMRDKDQVRLTSKVFLVLGYLTFISYVAITPFMKIIFQFLFAGEYVKGYSVAPYLFLAPLLLMLFQTVGQQLLMVKKTRWIPVILSSGALANIMLNLVLIPYFGIEGAAIATLAGYAISVFLVVVVVKKMKLIEIPKGFVFLSVLVAFYTIVYFLSKSGRLLSLITPIIIIIVLLQNKNSLRKVSFGRIMRAVRNT